MKSMIVVFVAFFNLAHASEAVLFRGQTVEFDSREWAEDTVRLNDNQVPVGLPCQYAEGTDENGPYQAMYYEMDGERTLFRKFRQTQTRDISEVVSNRAGEVIGNIVRNYRTTDVEASEPIIARGKRIFTCKDWRGLDMNLNSSTPSIQLQELRKCSSLGPILDLFIGTYRIHTGVKCQ